MQAAMRAVFDVWPEVSMKVYVQAERAEEATEAAWKVCEELKDSYKHVKSKHGHSTQKETRKRRNQVLPTSRWIMKDNKMICKAEGRGLTCRAEYVGNDVRV